MKFDKNLATIHAYLCADGYVIRNPKTQKHKYYVMGFRNTNLTLLKDFQKKFEKIFKIKPRLTEGERCKINSKEIYQTLIDKFGSFYSWKWNLPSLTKELSKLWLRAYFVCESWVICKSHQSRLIALDSVNKKGINQIKKALKTLRIDSKIRKRGDRNIYTLHIFGKNNLIKFNKKIGFLHPTKKEKLKEAINDYVNYYWQFPKENSEIQKFVKIIINRKGKIRKSNKIITIISNKEENLIRLQKELYNLFNIESRVGKRKNGIGTIYFELNINKRAEIEKVIENNLINKEEKEKWMRLKK